MFKKKEAPQTNQEPMEESIDFGGQEALDFGQDNQDDLDFDFDEDESTVQNDSYDPVMDEEPTEQPVEQQQPVQQQPVQQPMGQQQPVQQAKEDLSKQKQDIVLHFVIDRSTSDMLDYFRGYGINVSKIFNDIEDAKNEILMQINPCRIVIVDTGTGRFSLMGSRKALVDLLGIGDEDNKISVFYTDQAIRDDISLAEGVDEKQIDWAKYRSTADILATLLQKKQKENYIIDDTLESERTETSPEVLMSFKGLTTTDEMISLGIPTLNVEEISIHREEGSGNKQLQAYEIKY